MTPIKTALFVYHDAATDYFIPAYEMHAGQRVTIIGPYEPGWFRIRARDGWEGIAQPKELLEGELSE